MKKSSPTKETRNDNSIFRDPHNLRCFTLQTSGFARDPTRSRPYRESDPRFARLHQFPLRRRRPDWTGDSLGGNHRRRLQDDQRNQEEILSMTLTTMTDRSGFTADVRATSGLATLGPDTMVLRGALERRFLGWAHEVGAASMLYPQLMKVADLNRIDYFHNFPHLAMLCAPLAEEAGPHHARSGANTGEVSSIHLADAQYALPSAACYNVYLDMADTHLDDPRLVTTVATCFRREHHFDGLKRLLGFSMREIVCIGDREAVLAHLDGFKKRLDRKS